MADRLALHAILVDALGSSYVYFQPPATVEMQYPCIVYKRDDVPIDHADNQPYKSGTRYMITVIDKNPDSLIPGKIAALPTARFIRNFPADNLNHDVFTITI